MKRVPRRDDVLLRHVAERAHDVLKVGVPQRRGAQARQGQQFGRACGVVHLPQWDGNGRPWGGGYGRRAGDDLHGHTGGPHAHQQHQGTCHARQRVRAFPPQYAVHVGHRMLAAVQTRQDNGTWRVDQRSRVVGTPADSEYQLGTALSNGRAKQVSFAHYVAPLTSLLANNVEEVWISRHGRLILPLPPLPVPPLPHHCNMFTRACER